MLTAEEEIIKLTDTIQFLETKIKLKLVNTQDKEKYKKVIKLAKARIKKCKTAS